MPDTPIPPPFDAYTGNEPYIFVSYAHKDAATVFPEIVLLRDLGYRIWYDEGIDPGNEWPEAVAEALKSCACFIVFVSPSAVESRNVRDEIHLAIKYNKPLVPIHIAETELPGGLELRIGTAHAILKYRTSAINYLKLVQRALPTSVKAAPVSPVVAAKLQADDGEDMPTLESWQPQPLQNVELRRQATTVHIVSQRRTLPILTRPMLMTAGVFVALALGVLGFAKMNNHHKSTSSQSAPSVKASNTTAGEHPLFIAATQTKHNKKDGAEMVWIPAGPFLMGDDDDAIKDYGLNVRNNPRHKVTLSGYWIYRDLVTVGRYKKFCDKTEKEMPTAPDFNPNWSKENYPMVNVSWNDATAYCTWAEVSLPTEAQWEKAARGTDGRKYPWGNDWDSTKCVNSVGRSLHCTVAVGHHNDSPYGLSDMAGNSWHWCTDWYDANQNTHAERGGSWFDNFAIYFRTSYRYGHYPGYRGSNIGFRCVAAQ